MKPQPSTSAESDAAELDFIAAAARRVREIEAQCAERARQGKPANRKVVVEYDIAGGRVVKAELLHRETIEKPGP